MVSPFERSGPTTPICADGFHRASVRHCAGHLRRQTRGAVREPGIVQSYALTQIPRGVPTYAQMRRINDDGLGQYVFQINLTVHKKIKLSFLSGRPLWRHARAKNDISRVELKLMPVRWFVGLRRVVLLVRTDPLQICSKLSGLSMRTSLPQPLAPMAACAY